LSFALRYAARSAKRLNRHVRPPQAEFRLCRAALRAGAAAPLSRGVARALTGASRIGFRAGSRSRAPHGGRHANGGCAEGRRQSRVMA